MNVTAPLRAAALSLSAEIGCAERSAVRIGTSKVASNDPIFYGRGIPNYYSKIVLKPLFFYALVRVPFCRSGGARAVRVHFTRSRPLERFCSARRSRCLQSAIETVELSLGLCVAAAGAPIPISFIARRTEDVRLAEKEWKSESLIA